MTKRAVADATGLSEGYIGKIENGKKTPGRKAIAQLAQAFEVEPGFLFSNLRMTDDQIRVSIKYAEAIKKNPDSPHFAAIEAILDGILK